MDNPIKHYSDKLEFETDSWDLRAALDNGEKIIVVDARSTQSYEEEHIPGAVSIPHRYDDPRVHRESGPDRAVCGLLRWHRLQRLDEGCSQPDATGISREGVDRWAGLVEARWICDGGFSGE